LDDAASTVVPLPETVPSALTGLTAVSTTSFGSLSSVPLILNLPVNPRA
jgi:hypothetical protein